MDDVKISGFVCLALNLGLPPLVQQMPSEMKLALLQHCSDAVDYANCAESASVEIRFKSFLQERGHSSLVARQMYTFLVEPVTHFFVCLFDV